MKYKNEDVEIIIHIREGKYYKVGQAVTNIEWSGDIKSPSRSLSFDIIQPVNDNKATNIGVVAGSTVCFYVKGKEIFRGNVIDVEKDSGSNTTKIIANDLGFLLARDEISYNFVNKTPTEIAKEVLKGKTGYIKLAEGRIAKADTRLTKMYIGCSRYDAIMSAYTAHSKATGGKKKYMVEVDIDKFNVIEKGIVVLKVAFSEGSNISNTKYKQSIENLVSRVEVVDSSGNKKRDKVNKEIAKLYRYITKIKEETDKKGLSDAEIDAEFKGLEQNCSLVGYGDISCKAGYTVQVKDTHTGLVGEFYIDRDKHVWSGGNYTVELELNFDNIMDEKDASKEKETQSEGETHNATKDWGHGVSAEQLNKVLKGKLSGKGDLIVRYCNMYKVNPAIITAILCNESAYGTSHLANSNNNFFGMKTEKGWMKFSSIEEGLKRGISNISRNYINRGLNSYSKMVGRYAEGGSQWIPSNESIVRKITGKSSKELNFGTGVKTDAEAEANVVTEVVGNAKRDIILREAEKMVGKGSYTWGGTELYNSDCSGFVYALHKMAGIKIGQHSGDQLSSGRDIPLSQAQPGDIIITKSDLSGSGRHVMLYIGNGMVIHNGGPVGSHITKTKMMTGSWVKVRRCWD